MPAFLKRMNYRTKPDTILYVTNMWEHRLFCTFIPAPIGSSPRVWGTLFSLLLLDTGCGSSPRVWGTPAIIQAVQDGRRFIPTCVGNTHPSAIRCRLLPVHPHVCGEHSAIRAEPTCYHGSSPRVWGTHYFVW